MARTRKPASKISARAAAVAAPKGKRVGLPTKEIVAAVLNTKGVSLKGTTPGHTMAAILATSPDFERVEPGVYCLSAQGRRPR
jgi:HB1, ASXL, restriction endonuclease HTH domain